jgi:hypothetical protein
MLFKKLTFPNSARARDLHLKSGPKWIIPAIAGAAILTGLALLAPDTLMNADSAGETNRSNETGGSRWCYDPMNRKLLVKPAALMHCDKRLNLSSQLEGIAVTQRPVLLQSMLQF